MYIYKDNKKLLSTCTYPSIIITISGLQNEENNKPIKTSPDIFIIVKWIPNDSFQSPIIFQTPLIVELGHYQFPLALEINF